MFSALMADYLPFLSTVALVVAALGLAHWWLIRRTAARGAESQLPRQLLMLLLTLFGLILALLTYPLTESTRNQILSLLGIVLTAVIALSSTSFIANAMAGLMLRVVRTFRPGDFIRIGPAFGRVTQRGLFHTEIQTEDRDLSVLPNLYLVTNPMTVVHGDGTIVSTELSLGYDLAHDRLEPLLRQAAEKTGLEDPFVQVRELGDHAVTYRVAGFLADVRQLLSVRSSLRWHILDELHGNGIEIVSPGFVNQRRLTDDYRAIPPAPTRPAATPTAENPEAIIFDKAEVAARRERLRDARRQVQAELDTLHEERKDADSERRTAIDQRIARLQQASEALAERIGTPPV